MVCSTYLLLKYITSLGKNKLNASNLFLPPFSSLAFYGRPLLCGGSLLSDKLRLIKVGSLYMACACKDIAGPLLHRVTGLALRKTFFAIYGAVSGGLKRDLAFFPAVRADRLVQDSIPEIIAVTLAMTLTVTLTVLLIRPGGRPCLGRPRHGFADQDIYLPFHDSQLRLQIIE